jgi:hypothetical protein
MSTVDIGECRGDEGDYIAVYYQHDFRRHQHAETLNEAVAGLWWGSDQNLLYPVAVLGPSGEVIHGEGTGDGDVYDAIAAYDARIGRPDHQEGEE